MAISNKKPKGKRASLLINIGHFLVTELDEKDKDWILKTKWYIATLISLYIFKKIAKILLSRNTKNMIITVGYVCAVLWAKKTQTVWSKLEKFTFTKLVATILFDFIPICKQQK